MAHRITKKRKALLAGNLHRITARRLSPCLTWQKMKITALPAKPQGAEDIISKIDDQTSCVVVQSPDLFGNLVDFRPIADAAQRRAHC